MSAVELLEHNGARRELREREKPPHELLIVAHAYQPPREWFKLSTTEGGRTPERADMLAFVNDKIYEDCYKPNLVERESLPPGMVTSFYGSLREWMKGHHPEGFEKVKAMFNNTPDKAYRVLGDPYLHPILPLLGEPNQDMLVKIGLNAFEEDLGFRPKGFWLPEAAVSKTSLKVLSKNGIEFVVLGNRQLQSSEQNPMFVRFEDGTPDIAIIHVDSGLSGDLSYNDGVTANADDFLKARGNQKIVGYASDLEFYGHHKPFKDQFLTYVTKESTLQTHGFVAFDVKDDLEEARKDPRYTDVHENSSWSCVHQLGRWTGECYDGEDGNLTEKGRQDKQKLYKQMTKYGDELDNRLDQLHPSWREDFVPFFLGVRRSMYYRGNVREDMQSVMEEQHLDALQDPEIHTLFLSQLARFTGLTSCYGFFEGEDRPEREIARGNINEIRQLVPDIESSRINPQGAIIYQVAS